MDPNFPGNPIFSFPEEKKLYLYTDASGIAIKAAQTAAFPKRGWIFGNQNWKKTKNGTVPIKESCEIWDGNI
jgi:hypothetical protein